MSGGNLHKFVTNYTAEDVGKSAEICLENMADL